MSNLSDNAVANLRRVMEHPDVADGRYEVLEQIGRGGMGVVFRARDATLGRDVALKVLNATMTSPDASARLEREARILARLEHPGIVPVYDAGLLGDGRVFYVMRLVRGTRLDEYTTSGASRGELLRLMLRLCETVAFAHEHGIVHRDLKPGNVMIGPFGEALILDWGVAKILQLPDATPPIAAEGARSDAIPVTADGVVVGTPGYMAPEQAAGESAQVDARADVFGLGVMLREVLAASGATSTPLRAIVARATALDAAHRYPSPLALAADLTRWLDGESVQAHQERWLERAGRFYRRHQVAILLLLAYVVMRAVILFWRRI